VALNFSERSVQICRDFLQTAVIIDDRAFKKPFSTQPTIIQKPTRGDRKVQEIQKSSPKEERCLNTQDLIESFADKGIVCSALEFTDYDNISASFINIAKLADIVIIDWEMENERTGENALKLISSLIENDFFNPQRFRLVTIYTGYEDLSDISQKLAKHIKKNHDQDLDVEQNGLRLINGTISISIFAKSHSVIPEHFRTNVANERALPEKIIRSFSESISGILPNTALSAITAIRHSTHHLLAKFNKNLDYAFLTHRASSPKPDDTVHHLETFIAEEIKSILYSYNCVGQNASFSEIKKWFFEKYHRNYIFNHPDGTELKREDILDILKKGSEKATLTNLSKSKKKKLYLHFTKLIVGDETPSSAFDLELSRLSVLKTRYQNSSPYLTAGIVLQQISNKTLWLCIQPKCDSVRLEGESCKFPLLPIVSGIGKKSALKATLPKLCDESTDNFYHIIIHPQNCRTIEFKSAKKDKSQINPKRLKDKWIFLSTEKLRFQFISELKEEITQNILNDFAATTARVGTNPSEWLRKSGKRD